MFFSSADFNAASFVSCSMASCFSAFTDTPTCRHADTHLFWLRLRRAMKSAVTKVRFGLRGFLLVTLAVCSAANFLYAQELSGTLKKVHDSSTVVIGYRESSIPFSYLNARGEPIGYSIDLGRAIVDAISNELNDQALNIKFVPVTSESRIEAVKSGAIDLECGSTTNNTERQKEVAFSPVMFVAGTKLLVKRGSPIQSFRDLAGKNVAATAGTTNEQAMLRLSAKFGIKMNLVLARDHEESYEQLASGKVDAFAGDDVLLYGLVAEHKSGNELIVVGDFLSFDPYGIMYRKDDPQLADVVNRVFREMAASRDLQYTYDRWFLKKLPSGETLNLPMSAQLEEIFRALGAPD
jgi:ABC-type amino acid transport substrate-binding protein